MNLKYTILLVLAFVVPRGMLMAQSNNQKAEALLKALSAKYKLYDAIKTSFTYRINDPQSNTDQSQSGILYVKPGEDKYRVELAKQTIISNGTISWMYLKEVNEVQVNKVQSDGQSVNPSQLFTLYEKGFKYALKGESQVNGTSVYLIDLVPLEDKAYSKIEIAIDKSGDNLRQMKIFDKNGTQYTYTINKLIPNPSIGDKYFSFDTSKHPGVDVVDLR